MTPARVVVAGTGFGRVYLAGAARPDSGVVPAGVLARGSPRSQACARSYGVPLYTAPEQVPDDVDLVAVVVGAAINGGPGGRLARTFLDRGLPVLQEHPLDEPELRECLRSAHRSGTPYRVNTHYPHVAPVRRFVALAQALVARQRPLFVDVVVAFQVAYTAFDILGRALGGLRPWGFGDPAPMPARARAATPPPFRALAGVLAGVPVTVQLQNELVPAEADSHAHLYHRITIGTEGGHLTLVNTHGPVLWSPRPYMPAEMAGLVRHHESAAAHLDARSVEVAAGPPDGASYREILGELWPAATAAALREFAGAVRTGLDPAAEGQYHLTLTRITKDLTDRCGPPRLGRPGAPEILTAADLTPASAEAGPGPRVGAR